MKKCSKCGAINDNLYVNCIDCGAQLGPPLSREELREAENETRNPKKKQSKKSDFFTVSRSDKKVSTLLSAGAILYLLLILNNKAKDLGDYKVIMIVVILWMLAEAFSILNPRITWRLYQLRVPKAQEDKDPKISEDMIQFNRGMAYFTAFVGYALLIYLAARMML